MTTTNEPYVQRGYWSDDKYPKLENLSKEFIIHKQKTQEQFDNQNDIIEKQSREYTKLKTKYDEITLTLSAREIGNIADRNALDKIFPKCRQKPYGIRTLSNLNIFLMK